MAEEKSPEDLENLAKTLEVELDPTQPPVQAGPSQVTVNPTLETEPKANVAPPPAPSAPAADEISLTDLFGGGATEAAPAAEPAPVQEAPKAEAPPPEAAPEKDKAPAAPAKGIKKVFGKVREKAIVAAKRTYDWSSTVFTYVKKVTVNIKDVGKKGGKKAGVWTLDLWVKVKSVKDWTRREKLILLALVLTVGAIIALLGKNRFLKPGHSKSLMDIAEEVVVLPDEYEEVKFLSGEAGFDDVLLIKKIVVNIKRSEDSSTNPMVAFECYLQNSNQEVAVEIRDRELEIRDAISRLTEEFSYKDLNSIEGKNRFKLIMRRELNARLSRGRVVGVFFKTFILKP